MWEPLYFDLMVQRYSPLTHAVFGVEHSATPSVNEQTEH